MDLRQLEVFVKVAELKSFSKAADALNISQPTVSNHISNLESELRTRLFDRLGRQVILTYKGKILLKHARELLRKKEKALSELTSEVSSGTVKVAASTIPGEYIIPKLLLSLRNRTPETVLEVDIFDTEKVIRLLSVDSPEYEIGFTGSFKVSRKLEFVPIVEDELVLVAPSKYKPSLITVGDLRNMPLIVREKGSGTRHVFEEKLKEFGIYLDDLNIIATFSTNTAVKEAVYNGAGFGIISRYSIKNDDFSKLKVVEIKDLKIKRMFYKVKRKDITLSPVAKKVWNEISNILVNS